jgi:hypothetical protein
MTIVRSTKYTLIHSFTFNPILSEIPILYTLKTQYSRLLKRSFCLLAVTQAVPPASTPPVTSHDIPASTRLVTGLTHTVTHSDTAGSAETRDMARVRHVTL